MKKSLTAVVLVAMLCPMLAGAEELAVKNSGLTGMGLKAGLNLTSILGSDSKDAQITPGFAGGGFLTWSFTEMWAAQIEVLYEMKGANYEPGDVKGVSTKLQYLDIPLLARINIPVPASMSIKPNFVIGPNFGILLDGEVEYTDDLKTASEAMDLPTSIDITDDVNPVDVGITIGAGVEIPAGPGKVLVDLRYTYDFTKVGKDVNDVDAPETYNSAFGILVGYNF